MLTIDDFNIAEQKRSIKAEQDQIRERVLVVQWQVENLKAFKVAHMSKQSMDEFYSGWVLLRPWKNISWSLDSNTALKWPTNNIYIFPPTYPEAT